MTFYEIINLLISKIETEWNVELWEIEDIVFEVYTQHAPSPLDTNIGKDRFVSHGEITGRTIRMTFRGDFLTGEVEIKQ